MKAVRPSEGSALIERIQSTANLEEGENLKDEISLDAFVLSFYERSCAIDFFVQLFGLVFRLHGSYFFNVTPL